MGNLKSLFEAIEREQDIVAAEQGSDSSSEKRDDQFLKRRPFSGSTMLVRPILLARL